jgi:hypothetical protein
MAENEVAKVEKAGVPAVYDYGADAGRGFEDQGQDEISIPFISVLQGLSPQVTGENGKEVEGAKPGKLFNTITEEVLGNEVLFVPASREHIFTEWIPRKQGGGFVGRFDKNDPVVAAAVRQAEEFGKYRTPAGNDLVETYYLFGVICPEGAEPQPVVIAFTSTKIKAYKKWNTTVNMFTVPGPNGGKIRPPRFAHLLKVSSISDKNKKGSFFNLSLKPANGSIRGSILPPDDPRYLAAKALAEMVASGKAKAADDSQAASSSAETDEIDGKAF